MSRIRHSAKGPKRSERDGIFAPLAGWLFVASMLAMGADASAAPSLRIAVAPFAGQQDASPGSALSIAKALAVRLSDRRLERVIAPGDFVAAALFEPRASEIRRWAYNSAVDTIIVGRVVAGKGSGEEGSRIVETVVRSGHSGAEISRHEVVVPDQGDLDRWVERLAVAILEGLGHVEPPAADGIVGGTPTSATSSAAEGDVPGSLAGSSTSGFEVAIAKSSFRGGAPIEIKADEAEIYNREEGRRLIFRRNVLVRQDNVTLRSDRLEAVYRKGESEPRELIAEGRVRIVQDDRRAKCDRAIYMREESRLICKGHAELVQGCDVIRGELIEFDLAGDRARVEGAASIVIQHESAARSECKQSRGRP